MKQNKTALFIIMLVSVITAGCASTDSRFSQIKQADIRDAEKLLKKIEILNETLPKTFTAKISVNAAIEGRSFKTGGTISFAKDPKSIKITMLDLIFRSIFAELLYQSDTLKFFMPLEKTLYVREKNPSGETAANLELNPEFVSMTALGRIPLISGYTVTKSYTAGEAASAEQIIVLENDSFYESIAARDGIPSKVRILSKKGGDKFEAHFDEPVKDGQVLFYKKISAFSENSGNKFDITYSSIVFNAPIDAKVFTINVPQGTKIVK
jgi:hypothetical protein